MKKTLHVFLALLLCAFSMPNAMAQVDFTIGTGTTSNGSSTYPSPYGDYYMGSRMQYIFLASELSAAGMTPGNITAIKWNVTATNSSGVHEQWQVKIGTTTATSLTAWQTGLTTVIGSTNYTPTSGVNTHTFSTPFFWNGSSNIVVEVCHGDPSNTNCVSSWYTNNASVNYTVMSYNASMTYRADCLGNLCGATSNSSLNPTWRPNTTFSLVASSPCLAPSPVINARTSTTASASWGAVSGASGGYEYAVTTTSTLPASGTITTSTTATVTGLTPATNYFLHVRTKCTPPAQSAWATIPFSTYPPCTKPSNIIIANLKVDEATIAFRRLAHATGYTYLVDQDRSNPTSTSATTNTTDSFFTVKQLAEGTKYYVHIRVMCPGGEMSDWLLDSFTTLIVCRPPQLFVDNLDANRAVIHWEPVRSAVKYEYEISQSPTPLGKGTTIERTNFLAFPLKENQTYYFHVRSQCVDQERPGTSDWNTTSFRTFPTAVANVNSNGFAVQVYPNPVNDILMIKTTGTHTASATATITDLTGKVLRVAAVQQDITEIDMSSMTPGVYFVRFTDNLQSETIRVIKK